MSIGASTTARQTSFSALYRSSLCPEDEPDFPYGCAQPDVPHIADGCPAAADTWLHSARNSGSGYPAELVVVDDMSAPGPGIEATPASHTVRDQSPFSVASIFHEVWPAYVTYLGLDQLPPARAGLNNARLMGAPA